MLPTGERSAHPPKWAFSVRLFHWLSVLFLVSIVALIMLHEYTDGAGGLYISLHKALGVCFLFWMVARLINRLVQRHPPQALPMPIWQQRLAGLVHSLLYVLLLLMPLSGFLMTQFAGRATNLFGLVEIPVLVMPDREVGKLLNQLHTELIWTTIIVLLIAHVGAALHHHFMLKDQTIKRIW